MAKADFKFPGMSRELIERRAEHLLHEFQPKVLTGDEPFLVERFVDLYLEELTGVKPDYRPLPPGIYGLTDQNEMVIDLGLMEDPHSRQFLHSTMGHEVAHAIYHVPILRKFGREQVFEQKTKDGEVRLYRRDDLKPYEDPEWQAWRFAAAVLMPRKVITEMCLRGYDTFDLARHFQVNRIFVQRRLKQLDLQSF
jgi:Zn-dependent peptidase ImmA (M78 family)